MRPFLFGVDPAAAQAFLRSMSAGALLDKPTCEECGRQVGFRVNGLCSSCRQQARMPAPSRPVRAARPSPRNDAVERERARKAQQERDIAVELRGSNEGRRLGLLHGGDPRRLASSIGARVEYGDARKMLEHGVDGWTLRSPSGKAPAFILLANNLQGGALDMVFAHELAHAVGADTLPSGGEVSKIAQERACDAFASAFLKQRPDPPWMVQAKASQAWEEQARRRALAHR